MCPVYMLKYKGDTF